MTTTDIITDMKSDGAPSLSVIVVVDSNPRIAELIENYRVGLDALDRSYEIVCVVDGKASAAVAGIEAAAAGRADVTAIAQHPWAGDDVALATALRRASAETVLVLPGWQEVDPADFGLLLDGLKDADLAIGKRVGAEDATGVLKVRTGLTNWMLRRLFGEAFSDVFCRARAGSRALLTEIGDYGVRQHFQPVLAADRGYKVREVEVRAGALDGVPARYVFKPLGHVRALLDVLALYVVLKFLRRPLRFFGFIGLPIFALGAFITFVLVMLRLFGGDPLADRPALIFAVMMVVLGVQIIALGLIGEIVIFANSRRMKTYEVEAIIRRDPKG